MELISTIARSAAILVMMLTAGTVRAAGSQHATPAATFGPDAAEWGKVQWLRNYNDAVTAAEKAGKPIMLMFDEVPGCGGCKAYGLKVLSNPLIVDAAEEFIPCGIRNNSRGDHDAEVVSKFKEKRWSYPIVRFVDVEGKDIIPRTEDQWQNPGSIVRRMVAALTKAKREVPAYMALLDKELTPASPAVVGFSMSCYWAGERNLGGLDGVLSVKAGCLDQKEVVEVTYDAEVIALTDLAEKARASCGRSVGVFVRSADSLKAAQAAGVAAELADKPLKPTSWTALSLSPQYNYLPLTGAQAARITSLLPGRQLTKADELLAPFQRVLKARLEALLKADRNAAMKILKTLTPERNFDGLATYRDRLLEALEQAEKKPDKAHD